MSNNFDREMQEGARKARKEGTKEERQEYGKDEDVPSWVTFSLAALFGLIAIFVLVAMVTS